MKDKTETKDLKYMSIIERAHKENNPQLLLDESGLTLDEFCHNFIDKKNRDYSCSTSNLNLGCRGFHCDVDNCIFNKDYESINKWMRQVEDTKEEFILPEKWYIERNKENYSKINTWFNEHVKISIPWSGTDGYMNYPRILNQIPTTREKDLLFNGYKEITFDQFKNYVLKEDKPDYSTGYLVALVDRAIGVTGFNKGCIGKVIDEHNFEYDEDLLWSWSKKDLEDKAIKWFPNKQEAEHFTETLLEPQKEEPIDSWCVQVTEENREVVKKWMNNIGYSYTIGSYYGITRKGGKDGMVTNWFDKKISTEEFYEKIGHVEEKKPFEFNKWYKNPDNKWLCFITSNTSGYGFDNGGKWFEIKSSGWQDSTFNFPQATDKEVEERLLEYAKKKYPIGTKFKAIDYDKDEIVKVLEKPMSNGPHCKTDGKTTWRNLYYKGKWAEIIKESDIETQDWGTPSQELVEDLRKAMTAGLWVDREFKEEWGIKINYPNLQSDEDEYNIPIKKKKKIKPVVKLEEIKTNNYIINIKNKKR